MDNVTVKFKEEMTDVLIPISTLLNIDHDTRSYPERVKMRYDYVMEQLAKNPNYVGWDYVEHWEYNKDRKAPEGKLIQSHRAMISTTGKLAKYNFNSPGFSVAIGAVSGYYLRTSFKDDDLVTHKNYLHRTVCSTFVPIPEELSDTHPSYLTSNHKNGRKFQNQMSNLEWVTQKQNLEHASKTQLIKHGKGTAQPIEGTIQIPGSWYGKKFALHGSNHIRQVGLRPQLIYMYLVGKLTLAHGSTWRRISKEEATLLPDSPPEGFAEFIFTEVTTQPRNYDDYRSKEL